MADWSWSSASKIHSSPNPIRRTRRATGSAATRVAVGVSAIEPAATERRYWVVRRTFHTTDRTARTSPMTSS